MKRVRANDAGLLGAGGQREAAAAEVESRRISSLEKDRGNRFSLWRVEPESISGDSPARHRPPERCEHLFFGSA